MSFENSGDDIKIIEISQWGNITIVNHRTGSYFSGTENLVLTTTEPLNLTGITNMGRAFSFSGITDTGNPNSWNMSQVTNILCMFDFARNFNQPLNDWDISRVTSLDYLFLNANSFNQPLDNWDTSSVTSLKDTFVNSAFDQPLGIWNLSQVTDMTGLFQNIALSGYNYNDILLSWSNQSVQTGITFNAGNFQYGPLASDAHDILTTTYGWNVIDGGLGDTTPPLLSTDGGEVIIGVGTTDNELTWSVKEDNPYRYEVYRNGSLITSSHFNNDEISESIDGLDLGIYNYTILVFDSFENAAIDTVFVRVAYVVTETITDNPTTITKTITITNQSIDDQNSDLSPVNIPIILILIMFVTIPVILRKSQY